VDLALADKSNFPLAENIFLRATINRRNNFDRMLIRNQPVYKRLIYNPPGRWSRFRRLRIGHCRKQKYWYNSSLMRIVGIAKWQSVLPIVFLLSRMNFATIARLMRRVALEALKFVH
jgi:glycogen synthase